MISGTTPSSMSTASASSTMHACSPGTSGPEPVWLSCCLPAQALSSCPMRIWSRR